MTMTVNSSWMIAVFDLDGTLGDDNEDGKGRRGVIADPNSEDCYRLRCLPLAVWRRRSQHADRGNSKAHGSSRP